MQIHTCITTTTLPSFFPPADPESGKGGPHNALYDRIHLWKEGEPFTFSAAPEAAVEPHLAFMREGEPPIDWAWWVNAERTFDTPLLAVASHDGSRWIALTFDEAIWASSNVGDDRACFHLFPYFGDLPDGESASVEGRLYIVESELDQLQAAIAGPKKAP